MGEIVDLGKKKKVGVGHKITRTEMEPSDRKVESSNQWLRRSGQAVIPPSSEYIGSACVHFYRDDSNGNRPVFHFGVIADLGSIQEGNADVGLKELRRRLMNHYGRKAD